MSAILTYKKEIMTYDEIRRRYKRLIRHMMQVAILCDTEAVSAIQSYQILGHNAYGCEAVGHYGGCVKVITEAIKMRHYHNIFLKKNFIQYVLVNKRSVYVP